MNKRAGLGPGTVRVGRFVGRLGVVSLPAVQVGLDLDERVVRRHAAKLEAAGWLGRARWVWGEGSVVWLTGTGVQGAGLGGVRAVKSPPAPTTIGHSVLVGWSAARAEHRGRTWKSAREVELDRERWAAPMRCERGYAEQLPDLAVWLTPSTAPAAVIAESGGRREDRQKVILEGWRDAIWSGRYAVVRYDCTSPSVARWITRLAKKAGLTDANFTAAVQTTAAQIAALPPAAADNNDEAAATDQPTHSERSARSTDEERQTAPARARADQATPGSRSEPPAPDPDTAEAAAERDRRYRELFGIDDPKPRRRWRR